MLFIAVTLDGAIIHRSGLITGGPTSPQSTKQWDEKDVDGNIKIKTINEIVNI